MARFADKRDTSEGAPSNRVGETTSAFKALFLGGRRDTSEGVPSGASRLRTGLKKYRLTYTKPQVFLGVICLTTGAIDLNVSSVSCT